MGKVARAFLQLLPILVAFSFLVHNCQCEKAAQSHHGIAGRAVIIPAKMYRGAFKTTISLGDCPLVMQEGSIKVCKDKFTGDPIFIHKGPTVVDVTKVRSSEDTLLHVMGGFGTSVGVLGVASVGVKYKVAVTTQTSTKTLNLISSYQLSKGMVALQNPRPAHPVSSDSVLYLSEIELGGNELLMVSLEFESESKKVEVEMSVTFKVLFISITAKLKFVKETFTSKVSTRVQFKSSWRKDWDQTFFSLDQAIPKVEEFEKMYSEGPKELREMDNEDEKLHNLYYFSSWKQTPYGKNFNQVLVNHDIQFLTEQNIEMKSAIHRINDLYRQLRYSDKRKQLESLNGTLTQKVQELSSGLDSYHELSTEGRHKLRQIYGEDRAPEFYQRTLNKIIS